MIWELEDTPTLFTSSFEVIMKTPSFDIVAVVEPFSANVIIDSKFINASLTT